MYSTHWDTRFTNPPQRFGRLFRRTEYLGEIWIDHEGNFWGEGEPPVGPFPTVPELAEYIKPLDPEQIRKGLTSAAGLGQLPETVADYKLPTTWVTIPE